MYATDDLDGNLTTSVKRVVFRGPLSTALPTPEGDPLFVAYSVADSAGNAPPRLQLRVRAGPFPHSYSASFPYPLRNKAASDHCLLQPRICVSLFAE